MNRITPNLWFDSEAEEAANFYASIFPNSSVGAKTHYSAEASKMAGRPVGSVMTVAFELDGNPFLGLNGGPIFKFNEAVSFIINCDTQQEIDHYWDGLTAGGGEPGPCGWLKDRFGVSWQVVPSMMSRVMAEGNDETIARIMKAVLQMKKLDMAELQRAYEGK
jgi:predicted 3-demethylubiquinone-9 3-methyltransferase (glyoxalase superfamily)